MDNYILYHATNIKAGNDIIEKQSFDIKEDKDNTELLGEGAYYYNNRQYNRYYNKNSNQIS